MTVLEKIIVISVAIFAFFGLCAILFSFKKKNKSKEKSASTAKVEPAINGDKSNKKEEDKAKKQEAEKKEDIKFKVIKKKSDVKISKKALKSGSRNPSITRVFERGKMLEEGPATEDKNNEEIQSIKDFEPVLEKKPPERFFPKDYEYSETNTSQEFMINASKGAPRRSPMLGDRTNFRSHLTISEDGNLSGVTGTGIHAAANKALDAAREIDKKNEEMISKVHEDLLGSALGSFESRHFGEPAQAAKERDDFKEKLDSETLILVDALMNPKFKKKDEGKN